MINFSSWITLKDIQIINIIKIKNMNSKTTSENNIKQNKSESQRQSTNNNNPLIIHQRIISRHNREQQSKNKHNKRSASIKRNLNGILPANLKIMAFQQLSSSNFIARSHIHHEKLNEKLYYIQQVVSLGEVVHFHEVGDVGLQGFTLRLLEEGGCKLAR